MGKVLEQGAHHLGRDFSEIGQDEGRPTKVIVLSVCVRYGDAGNTSSGSRGNTAIGIFHNHAPLSG